MQQTKGTRVEELVKQFVKRLGAQGYEVEEDARVSGRSGAEHSFDVLASRDDGFTNYTIAADFAGGGEKEVSLGDVFAFDDKCYDCGIRDKVLVALPGLDPVASRFAQNQKIRVFDEDSLSSFLSSPLPSRLETDSLTWGSENEIIESLARLGYKIERNARFTGRSGAEYSFDALAFWNDGVVSRKIGIDTNTTHTVDLDQVALFDAKAYDTAVHEKLLLITGQLSSEAARFAEHQRVRVLNVDGQAQEHDAPQVTTRSTLQDAVQELLSREPEQPAQAAEQEAVEEEEEQETGPKVERVIKERPQPEALQLIPEPMARRFSAVPLAIEDDALKMAMVNPADIFALEALALQSRMRIEPVAATEKEVWEAIDFYYRGFGQIEQQASRIPGVEPEEEATRLEVTDDTPVASALRLIVDEASKARASDVHLEPEEDRLRVRYRIDGALQDVMSLPIKIHRPLTSRIKIMGDMNIADHLRPQDGQFSINLRNRPIDIRVATSPTVHGETTVMRLLDKSFGVMDLPELGFSQEGLAKYENMLSVAFGMILLSGPTGSGKTTTLYASVNKLDKVSRNIITIEDPVEYRFENMNQIQINPRAGLTFASGLRSILRLDPDVILVGEIRDAETARIAVQSALTGHLVLSSIHANDAVGVTFRLLDLGIEPFLVASAVTGVVAQRMVRRVCPDCSRYKEGSAVEQAAYTRYMGEKRTKFLYGEGCDLCSYTGYRGRTGLYEVMPLSEKLRMLILKGAGTGDVRQQAAEEGMIPLMKEGMRKAKQGITTPSEVIRSAYSIY